MDHPDGASETGDVRLGFDRRVRLEFHGSKISSDGGLLLFRELNEVLGLHDIAGGVLRDTRTGRNRLHTLIGLLRQSAFGRMVGYDDVNDADRLGLDPVMRQVVGRRAVDAKAASTSQMGRFETEVLATADNRSAQAELPGHWIDRVHVATPPKWITLDMDSSVSPTHGAQEGTFWNGHFGCMCYHPLFVFNQFGHLERCALRPGNVHSADGWEEDLNPVIARYADRHLMRFFRADAAFAIPDLYKTLEAKGYFYAIRLRTNRVFQGKIAHLLKRPLGRPPNHVRRVYGDFEYQATSWDKPRRVVAKVEWHPGELFPRVGFVVTNLPMDPDWIIRFYNQRGTAEQRIKEGKQAICWTRLSCKGIAQNEVRLQLHALAYNLGVFLQGTDLPEEMADWSLTSLQTRLIKIGARGCPPCPRHQVPACRGCRQWRSIQSCPRGHPPAARTAGSRMRASAAKTGGKRLHWSVQRGVDQTKIRINPAAEATNHASFALQMPEPQRNRPEKLDRRTKRRHNDKDGVLLGECRLGDFLMAISRLGAIFVIGISFAAPGLASTFSHTASVIAGCGTFLDTSTVTLSPSPVTLSANDRGTNCLASAGASAGNGTVRVFANLENPNDFNITEQNNGRATAGASMRYAYTVRTNSQDNSAVPVSINMHASGSVSVINKGLIDVAGNLLNGGQRVSASLRVSGSMSGNGPAQSFEELISVSANTDEGFNDALRGAFTTPTVNLRPGQIGTITFGLSGSTTGLLFGTKAAARASAFNSLSFATDGDVFNLPDGYFVEIEESRIVNNRYTAPTLAPVPLPASGIFLLVAVAGLAFSKRRAA